MGIGFRGTEGIGQRVSRWFPAEGIFKFKFKIEQTHLCSFRRVPPDVECPIARVPRVVFVLQVPLGIIRVLDEKIPSCSLVVGRLEEVGNVGVRWVAALVSPGFDQQRRVSRLGQVGRERTTTRPAADDNVVIGGRLHHRYRRQGGKREQKHGDLGWSLSVSPRRVGETHHGRHRPTPGQEAHLYKTSEGAHVSRTRGESELIGSPFIARLVTGHWPSTVAIMPGLYIDCSVDGVCLSPSEPASRASGSNRQRLHRHLMGDGQMRVSGNGSAARVSFQSHLYWDVIKAHIPTRGCAVVLVFLAAVYGGHFSRPIGRSPTRRRMRS